jgi:hypothetical protein
MSQIDYVRVSSEEVLNFDAVKALCSMLNLCFARKVMFTSNISSKFLGCKNG